MKVKELFEGDYEEVMARYKANAKAKQLVIRDQRRAEKIKLAVG